MTWVFLGLWCQHPDLLGKGVIIASSANCRRKFRDRGEETAGVVVVRMVEYFLGLAGFHDLPAQHHGDAVGQIMHHAEVVGYENHGQAEVFL